MKKKTLFCSIAPAIGIFLLVFALFQVLYQFDNKYTTAPAYGEDGVYSFSEKDLEKPLFLIDGWELYPDVYLSPQDFSSGKAPKALHTFIGQFPNFSFFSAEHSPFGSASYRLKLRFADEPRTLLLYLPEIFTDYSLWADEKMLAHSGSGSTVLLELDGDTDLLLSTENHSHYYSGMTYPPAIGTIGTIQNLFFTRDLFYGFLCTFSLALCLFAIVGRRRSGNDPIFLHFGLLCLFFALHCSYPFLHQLGLNSPFCYAFEDASWLFVLYETILLCTLAAGLERQSWFRFFVRPLGLFACLLCFFWVSLIIPGRPSAVNIYGGLIDGWKLICWLYLMFCAVYGLRHNRRSGAFLLAGGGVLAAAQLVNLLDNNHFEPIYTGWQAEYAGFFLVLVFWAMIMGRVRQLRKQNRRLNEHLEDLVQQRTAELHTVLRERKSFFSDMAHNLKAPVAAIHGFVSLILQENLYLDEELRDNLNQISSENAELQRRMEALSGLNAFDKISEPSETIQIDELLRQIKNDNEPEACISGIHLLVQELGVPAFVIAQRKKLLLLFENLIYNALSFTPEDGSITLVPRLEGDEVVIEVSDNGSGIAEEHLPHIFERFYTARENKSDGSGLGLYIAKLTLEELGGSISATSLLGCGSCFTIRIPKA
ncbi:MAG: HAMP domain-containing sensor histidine kinase [Oscillospiraceae bacterium]